MELQRYDIPQNDGPKLRPREDGMWVLRSEAQAEINRLCVILDCVKQALRVVYKMDGPKPLPGEKATEFAIRNAEWDMEAHERLRKFAGGE